jgi:uncharacterized protein (DUF302 family)
MINKVPRLDRTVGGDTEISARPRDVVELRSVLSFAETVIRVEEEIAARGLQVFARVDHAANARAVGLVMPPTTVVTFGNALGGTPLMVKAPALALDLPLRILVRQASDRVLVSYHEPSQMLAGFGFPASAATPLQALSQIAQASTHA